MNAPPTPTRTVAADLAYVRTLCLNAHAAYLRLLSALSEGTLTPDERRAVVLACGAWERADDAACIALERVENYVEEA